MEVNNNKSVGPVQRPLDNAPTTRVNKATTDGAVFKNTEALDNKLEQTPDARPEVVAKAMKLVANVQYPPTETIQRIANLLALNMQKE
jgi:hypothetical protein